VIDVGTNLAGITGSTTTLTPEEQMDVLDRLGKLEAAARKHESDLLIAEEAIDAARAERELLRKDIDQMADIMRAMLDILPRRRRRSEPQTDKEMSS
jgi:hypothetical protein